MTLKSSLAPYPMREHKEMGCAHRKEIRKFYAALFPLGRIFVSEYCRKEAVRRLAPRVVLLLNIGQQVFYPPTTHWLAIPLTTHTQNFTYIYTHAKRETDHTEEKSAH